MATPSARTQNPGLSLSLHHYEPGDVEEEEAVEEGLEEQKDKKKKMKIGAHLWWIPALDPETS